jgi:drug/metabolite transporter (DMT)-like permease
MKPNKNILFIHLAVILFGFAGLFGKWIMLPPLIIVFGRVVFASVALLIFGTIKKILIIPKNWMNFIVLGALLAIHWYSFFASIQISTVAIGLLSFSSFPIFTNLLEPLILKSPLQRRNILLSFVTLLGIYWIIPQFSVANNIFIGVLWGLLSGLTFAFLAIWNKKMVSNLNALTVAFFQDLSAAVFLLPFAIIIVPEVDTNQILLLAALGILFTAFAHTLFIEGLHKVSAGKASLIATLEPLYGILGGYLFLKEIPTETTVFGGILILVGVIFSKR